MKKNSGSTLLAVLALLAIMSAFIYGAMNYTAVLSRNVQRTSALRTATEVGDGALEYAFANWREICRVDPGTQYWTACFSSTGSNSPIPLPTQAMFPGIANFTASSGPNPATGTPYTIANFGVVATDPQLVPNNNVPPATLAPPATGTNLQTNSFYYLASADVTIPGFGGRPVTAKVRRVFQKQQQSPWNYAIFYNDLLEINPGAAQTITGWVHTNGNLYTAINNLTFASKVDYGGDWANGTAWAPGDSDHPPAAPTSPHYAASQPPSRGPVQEPFGIDTAAINAKNGTNQTDSQVYAQLIAPGVSNPDFGANSYYNQASIRISMDASYNVTLKNSADTVINASSTGNDLALYNAFTAAITLNSKIQDNREASTVQLVDLDMSVITSALTAKTPPGLGNSGPLAGTLIGTGFTGIIYATNTTKTASAKGGVRLRNGASMPITGGITVASNNGVYIQGDYNTGQTSSLQTPANKNNNGTGSNTVTNYIEQSCAVLGDAVMVLSNAWSDSADKSGVVNKASPTTINAAIVSGVVPTSSAYSGANSYSGGAENFPRLLEDWGGKTFTYYGSMVELFQSQQFTGRWGSNNVYAAANRNWNFDTLFYTKPPPGSLILYSFIQQRWFVQ